MSTRPTEDDKPKTATQPDLQAILSTSKSGKRKSRKTLWALSLVALGLIAGGYYWGFGSSDTKIFYTTQKISRGDISMIVTSTGTVQPTDKVDVSSVQSGAVKDVYVRHNDIVKEGDVLAELDTNRLEADLQNAKAKLASAQAAVLKGEADAAAALATLERRKAMFSNKVISKQDLDTAQFSYDSASATLAMNKASVQSAEADLRVAEVELSRAKIVSPIDGMVLSRDVEPGAAVAASLNAPVLFVIAGDLKKMELQVAVDEADVGSVKEGQKATFTVDAFPNRRFPATIETVRFVSTTVQNVVTYTTVLSVDNEELLLRPGMTATANIVVDSVEDALLVPNAALRFKPSEGAESSRRGGSLMGVVRAPRMGGPRGGNRNQAQPGNQGVQEATRTIYVLRSGVPTPVEVKTGVSDGRFTAVTSDDLKEGDEVIIDALGSA